MKKQNIQQLTLDKKEFERLITLGINPNVKAYHLNTNDNEIICYEGNPIMMINAAAKIERIPMSIHETMTYLINSKIPSNLLSKLFVTRDSYQVSTQNDREEAALILDSETFSSGEIYELISSGYVQSEATKSTQKKTFGNSEDVDGLDRLLKSSLSPMVSTGSLNSEISRFLLRNDRGLARKIMMLLQELNPNINTFYTGVIPEGTDSYLPEIGINYIESPLIVNLKGKQVITRAQNLKDSNQYVMLTKQNQ